MMFLSSSTSSSFEVLGVNMEDKEIKRTKGAQGEMEMEAEQECIPGLPNSVVKEHIGTKIPWSAMLALTKVNREWRRAIRSREIHDLRKRCGAPKPMVVVPVSNTTHNGFYDVESRGTYLFRFPPPEPEPPKQLSAIQLANWDPEEYGYICVPEREEVRTSEHVRTVDGVVFLDEKLYAIRKSGGNTEDILVLDVGACESEWKICTRWELCNSSVTSDFYGTELWVACNGKIYSFHTCKKLFHGRVFDPQSNQWREIEERPRNVCHPAHNDNRRDSWLEYSPKELRQNRFADRTAVFNKEIYVGWTWGKEMMIFDSVTERWRVVRSTLLRGIWREEAYWNRFNMLVINEKLYNFSPFVEIYDPQNNSWMLSQQTFHERFGSSADVAAVACYGNELLAMLDSESEKEMDHDTDYAHKPTRRFCKSVGFGVEGETLTWEEVPDFSFVNCFSDTAPFQLGRLEL